MAQPFDLRYTFEYSHNAEQSNVVINNTVDFSFNFHFNIKTYFKIINK